MISIIVAVAENGVIGCKNRLIWHIGEDLKRFKRITTGHPVVMGRKTFESLGGKPLRNRVNVVVTRNADLCVPQGVIIASSLDEAVAEFPASEEVFVIGGGEIYRQALPVADRLYLTRIHALPEGDTSFPDVSPEQWRLVWREENPVSEENPIGYEFADYIRIKKA